MCRPRGDLSLMAPARQGLDAIRHHFDFRSHGGHETFGLWAEFNTPESVTWVRVSSENPGGSK